MGMRSYIIRRLLLLPVTLIGVTILIFAVVQSFTPVQRASLYVTDPRHAYRALQEIIRKYRLNDPFYVQYYLWIQEVFKGNLGWSRSFQMRVSDAIINFAPATAELVMYTVPLTVLLGIYLGKISAKHRDKPLDHLTRALSIIGWSLPSFWLGILLLAFFYGGMSSLVQRQTNPTLKFLLSLLVFPPERLGLEASTYVDSPYFIKYTGLNTIDALLNGQLWIFFDALRHLVLPVITLTIIQVALIVRIMRSSMLEALSKGYILAARAKGLSEDEVINKHAKRNALIPVITVSGLLFAGMLSGVVITETVFEYKGIGYFAATAARRLDIPGVLGFALFSGFIFVIANLIVDILYAYIDPRIRLR